MFGYIEANIKALTEEQLARYRGCYCGLCRALQRRHGAISRMTLNYDMTFLVILLSSMYEPECEAGNGFCLVHPMKRRDYWMNRFTDYAADMNVALAYHNCIDDWKDDKNAAKLAEAKMLEKSYREIAVRWPEKCAAIERCMDNISVIEKNAGAEPDAATNCFGEMMGELFVFPGDAVWEGAFRKFGEALGRFIYMMDACVDLEKDKRRGSYNPLVAMGRADINEEEKQAVLAMLIGECTIEFEKLPVLQDVEIMRNILYSGVWTQYASALKKKGDKQLDK